MENFGCLALFDVERVLSGGHLVVHEPESSAAADEAGYRAWLRAKSVPHNPSISAGLYTFRLSEVHVAWIALVSEMGQGFMLALSADELRIVLTHDFKLIDKEFALAIVVDFGWQKEVMSVWRKDGRGGGGMLVLDSYLVAGIPSFMRHGKVWVSRVKE